MDQLYNRCILSIGSNLGDRKTCIEKAVNLIALEIKNISISSYYESESWGFSGPDFLNIVLAGDTKLSGEDLLKFLSGVELSLGRKRDNSGSYRSREIDIDIIAIEHLVMNTPNLKIPHALMDKRLFVLEPMLEVAPDWIHPISGMTISRMIENIRNVHSSRG